MRGRPPPPTPCRLLVCKMGTRADWEEALSPRACTDQAHLLINGHEHLVVELRHVEGAAPLIGGDSVDLDAHGSVEDTWGGDAVGCRRVQARVGRQAGWVILTCSTFK